jgi:predicted nucleotidyltransferase
MRRTQAIEALQGHLPELRQRFGVKSLSVFGSVARDDAGDASDVDVLVEFQGDTTFDGYFGLKEALERLLGAKVDLATPSMLKPRMRPRIEREAIHVS